MAHGLGFGQTREVERGAGEAGKLARTRNLHLGEIDARLVDRADFEQQRLLEHERAVTGGGGGRLAMDIARARGAPAGGVDGHAQHSASAASSASISSSVTVSVTAITSPLARLASPG
jgi:hypothetical protein